MLDFWERDNRDTWLLIISSALLTPTAFLLMAQGAVAPGLVLLFVLVLLYFVVILAPLFLLLIKARIVPKRHVAPDEM
jgi:hypothetical protein